MRIALTLAIALLIPAAPVAAATQAKAPAPQSKPKTAPARPKSSAAGTRMSEKAGPAIQKIAEEAAQARDAGRLEDAIALYRKALAIQPSWAEGLWYLGTIQYDLDRYSDARDAFGRLVAIDERRGAAWAFKGLCEFQLRNYERALTDLQRSVRFGVGNNPELSNVVRYHSAILTIRNGEFEQALDLMTGFAVAANDSPSVIEAFGLATLRMPILPADLQPDRRELVLMAGRAGFHTAARQRVAAQQEFEEVISRYPEAPNVHYAYGTMLLVENADKALEEFKSELKVSPNNVAAMLQMAFEYGKRSDFESALPYAKKAVALAPTMFPAHKAYGEALLGTGDVARAIDELETGVKLAPDSPSMRFSLAKAYQRAGRTQDADRERAEFLRLDKLYRTLKSGPQAVGGTINKQRP